jgi:hypothetical protein
MAYTTVPAGASGGGTTIGNAVTGATANRVLGVDGSGNLKDFADLTFNETTNDLMSVDSESGGTVVNGVSNTSNTASSHAEQKATVAGTSGGNPSCLLEITGGTSYRMLVDNADSDVWKVVSGTSHPAVGAAGFAYNAATTSFAVGSSPSVSGESSFLQVLGNANVFINAWAHNASVFGRAGFFATTTGGPEVKLRSYGSAAGATLGADAIPLAGVCQLNSQSGNDVLIGTESAKSVRFYTSGLIRFDADPAGNVVMNKAAIATTATDGFLYVAACAGTPTGVPTAKTGRVPIVVDSTNNKLYFYSGGAWQDAGP